MVKKYLLSFFVIIASVAYVIQQNFSAGANNSLFVPLSQPQKQGPKSVSESNPIPATPSASESPTAPPAQVPQPPPPSSPAHSPVPKPPPASPPPTQKLKRQYADGSYTGSLENAYYGMVQVKATIQNGKIVAVDFLQYPNDRRTSQYINSQAMPILQSEAIQAQSANVDIVSGATDTSMAFQQSLASALAKAKNI